jgi:hypothetical protein
METKLGRWLGLGTMALMAGLLALVLAPSAAAEESKAPPKRPDRDQQVRDGTWVKRIETRIERMKKLDAEHPNSPADVKAASEKLAKDLTALAEGVKKLAADLEAKNWEAVRADREAVQTGKEAVNADSKTFYELIKKQRAEQKPATSGGGSGGAGAKGAPETDAGSAK